MKPFFSKLVRSLALAGLITTCIPGNSAGTADLTIAEMLQSAATRNPARIEAAKHVIERQEKPEARDSAQAKRLNTEAISASKNGDLDAAIRLFKEALEADESSASITNNLCLAYLRAKNYQEAVAAGKSAIGLAPSNDKIWFNLGQAYGGNGMINQAAASFYLAIHFAGEPDRVRESLLKLSGANNPGMAAAAKQALNSAAGSPAEAATTNASPAARSGMQLGAPTLTTPVTPAVPATVSAPPTSTPARKSPLAAADIDGITSLALQGKDVPIVEKVGNQDSLFRQGEDFFAKGIKKKNEAEIFGRGVLLLKQSAFLGHKEAPGVLGMILSRGYAQAGTTVGPDVNEAKKLFDLTTARGGGTGYLGQAFLEVDSNPIKAITLFEKSRSPYDYLRDAEIFRLSKESKDPAVVAAASAAMKRLGFSEYYMQGMLRNWKVDTGEIILVPAKDTSMANAICTILQDQITNAARVGDRTTIRESQFKLKQMNCG